MAAIQKLLHNAQREGEVEENAYGVETREARIAKTTNTTAQDSEFAPIAHREGEAPAEPPQPAMDDATPETPNEPITPPKNRAQRRAQARIERKQQRKAAKQLRNANRRSGTGV